MSTPSAGSRWPGLVAVAVLLLGLWSAFTTRFQTELIPLFPAGLPSVRALRALESNVAENAVFIVPATGDAPSPALLETVAESLRRQHGITRVEISAAPPVDAARLVAARLATLPADRFAVLDNLLGEPSALAARLQQTQADFLGAPDPALLAARRIDPLQMLDLLPGPPVLGNLDAGGLPLLLRASTDAALDDFAQCEIFIAAVQRAIAETAPGAFLVTGRPAFAAQIAGQMRRDLTLMTLVAVALIAAAFWLFYRSVVPLLWILALQGLSVLAALIAARVLFAELNVIGLAFAAILLGVGMDYCILVYHHFARGERLASAHWPMLRRGIWLSAWTTASAFGVLYFASFPALRQLAVLVAVGLLATAFFATTLLARWLDRRPPALPAWLARGAAVAAGGLNRWRRVICTCGALLIAAILIAGPWLLSATPFFQTDLRPLRPLQLEAFRGQEQLTRIYTAGFQSPVREHADPERMTANLRAWNAGRGPAVARAFDAAGFDREWAAPTLAVLEELDRAKAAPDGLVALAGGEGVWVRLSEELATVAGRDFRRLSGIMLACIIALCFFAQRSLRLVLMNLGALAAAIALLFAGLAVTETPLTLVSLLCLPLLIGLVIDYSLHLLLALEEFDGDLRAVCDHLAAPVTLTALTAMVGFSAPMLSGLPILSNFGFVMDLGTLSAVTAALVLLPACYPLLRGKTRAAFEAVSSGATPERYPFFHRRWTYELASHCARVVPRWFIQGFARTMAWLYARGRPQFNEILADNLSLVLGRRPAPAEIARTYTSFAVSLADYYHLGARAKEDAIALVAERLGFEHMKAVHEAGRGALLLTAHLGLFELGGVVMRDVGFPIVALTLPEGSSGLSEWRAAYRRRWGVETLEVGGSDQFSFLEIQRHLAAGKFVAALIDRPHGGHTSLVQLPHGPARFASSILLIALAQGCPVVPVTVTRRDDLLYRVQAFEPFYIERHGSTEETLAYYAQRLADVFVPVITRHPEQWYQFVPLSPDASASASSPSPSVSPPLAPVERA